MLLVIVTRKDLLTVLLQCVVPLGRRKKTGFLVKMFSWPCRASSQNVSNFLQLQLYHPFIVILTANLVTQFKYWIISLHVLEWADVLHGEKIILTYISYWFIHIWASQATQTYVTPSVILRPSLEPASILLSICNNHMGTSALAVFPYNQLVLSTLGFISLFAFLASFALMFNEKYIVVSLVKLLVLTLIYTQFNSFNIPVYVGSVWAEIFWCWEYLDVQTLARSSLYFCKLLPISFFEWLLHPFYSHSVKNYHPWDLNSISKRMELMLHVSVRYMVLAPCCAHRKLAVDEYYLIDWQELWCSFFLFLCTHLSIPPISTYNFVYVCWCITPMFLESRWECKSCSCWCILRL